MGFSIPSFLFHPVYGIMVLALESTGKKPPGQRREPETPKRQLGVTKAQLLVWASPCVYSVRAFSVQVDLSVISSALNFGLQCTAKSEMKGKILVLPKFTEDCVSSCRTSVFTGFSAGKY